MKIYFFVAMLFIYESTLACDSCSSSFCVVNDQSFQLEKNQLGITWSYFSQQSFVRSFDREDYVKTKIYQYAATGSFVFKKKFNLSFAIPVYLTNTNQVNHFSVGDPILSFRYKLFESKPKKVLGAMHKVYATAGLKIPLGVYLNNDVNVVNNVNYSSRSVDFLLGATYLYVKKEKGVLTQFNTKINTKAKEYRYGHVFALKSLLFVEKKYKDFIFMPYAGVLGELILHDYSKGFVRPYTGGKALYTLVGVNISYHDLISIAINPELPILQDYQIQNGNVFTNIRLNINTRILF